MAKSFKKNPYAGIVGDSDKKDKRLANRRLRRIVKQDVVANSALTIREVSDVFDMNKDGKTFVGGIVTK
jgi:hypothetical protein